MADFETARRRMVDNQLRTSNVTDRRLLNAMGEVPRELFVPADRRELAYTDAAQPLGSGRALAEPAPFAKLVQLVALAHTDHVLDVGAATGYTTAVLAKLAADVTGLESDPALAAAARANLAAVGAANARIVEAPLDGSATLPGSFDVIVIEGAVDAEPSTFFHALRDGGRLVALLRSGATAVAHVYVRSGGEVAGRIEFNTTLPPLATAPRPQAFVF